jgi:hypothetical protein
MYLTAVDPPKNVENDKILKDPVADPRVQKQKGSKL